MLLTVTSHFFGSADTVLFGVFCSVSCPRSPGVVCEGSLCENPPSPWELVGKQQLSRGLLLTPVYSWPSDQYLYQTGRVGCP